MRKIVSAAILAAALSACSSTPLCENDDAAYNMAKSYIAREFMVLHTAEIEPFEQADIARNTYEGRCAFTIVRVAAPDRFGNAVLSRYHARIVPPAEEGGIWRAVVLEELRATPPS